MVLEPGQVIGAYEILSPLGRGGMGTVYRARDRRLDRQVALKFLHSGDGSDSGDRLLHEARAASALNHPNICQTFDVGGEGSESWIAMELVEGTPLASSIPSSGMAPDAVVRLAGQIAAAVSHAHARGILHRDLKSANIVCDRDGRPKILDFGIAQRSPQAIAEAVTQTGTAAAPPWFAGSFPYMAPEVLSGAPASERSDLWSLGILVYELLTGRLPFEGRSTFELASAIMKDPVPPLPPRVPAPLARAVLRLLTRDPGERYPSAEAFAADLAAIERSAPPSRTRLAVGVGVAAAVVVLGLVVWQARRFVPLVLSEQRLVSTVEAAHRAPSYSPDGAMLAYIAPDAAGLSQVWVKNLSAGTSIPITSGTAAASRPRWSPKGDRIVYALAGQGIWSVSPIGGSPGRILERGTNPNFSRDGARLVFEDRRRIWTATSDGIDVREVGGVPPVLYNLPRGPAFSPDGSQIAFFQAEAGPNGDLWTIPTAGGTARKLTSDLREGGWPVWTRDGRAIVYSSARAGSRTLWQVPASGGEPAPLTTGAGEDDQPDLTPDGAHVAYTNVRTNWDLRVRDLARGEERSLLQRGTEILFPMFAPDGKRIVFFGRADYAVAIFTVGADGQDLRQLTGGRELNHQPRWSADGADVYFFQMNPQVSFRRVPALGGPSVSVRPWEWQTTTAPYFDPTGRFIAYLRQRAPGAPASIPEHTVIHEIATGREEEWPEPHTHVWGWSPDGAAIVGTQHDGNAGNVVTCRVIDRSCRAVTRGEMPVWPRGDRIYFARPDDPAAPQELWSIKGDGSDERREAELGVFRSIDRFFHVSNNGQAAWAPFRATRHEIWTATVR